MAHLSYRLNTNPFYDSNNNNNNTNNNNNNTNNNNNNNNTNPFLTTKSDDFNNNNNNNNIMPFKTYTGTRTIRSVEIENPFSKDSNYSNKPTFRSINNNNDNNNNNNNNNNGSSTIYKRTRSHSYTMSSDTSLKVTGIAPGDNSMKQKLREAFQKYGHIKLKTYAGRDYAYVTLSSREAADSALKDKFTIVTDDGVMKPLTVVRHNSRMITKTKLPSKVDKSNKDFYTAEYTDSISDTELALDDSLYWETPNRYDKPASDAEVDSDMRYNATTISTVTNTTSSNSSNINTSPGKTQSIVGTCNDMCPESERFWREDNNLLSRFETISDNPKRIDHTRGIKEFSRNAADKPNPRPSELRTIAALQYTLHYICHSIVPLSSTSNLLEWHHYIENRLESLRQDITMQSLCSAETVLIYERCARFHILSAHLMHAHTAEGYDPKMNDNNLRKCLTTLQQQYDDLYYLYNNDNNNNNNNNNNTNNSSSSSSVMVNREEMTAYLLLLTIEHNNIHTELLNYPDVILKSPPVQFVLEVWESIINNNYIQFFKLYKRSTYLMACLMHRHVYKMQLSALRVITSVCTTKTATRVNIPLDALTELLAYEDAEDCQRFVTQCNMSIDKNSVIFTNSGFMEPDSIKPVYSYTRVCCKTQLSYGSIIYGSTIPTLPAYLPNFNTTSTTTTNNNNNNNSNNNDNNNRRLLEWSMPVYEEVFSEGIAAILQSLATKLMMEYRRQARDSLISFHVSGISESMLIDTVCLLLTNTAAEAVLECAEELTRRRHLREKLVDKLATLLYDRVVSEAVCRLGQEMMNNGIVAERRRLLLDRTVQYVYDIVYTDSVEDIIGSEVTGLVNEIMLENRSNRKLALESNKNEIIKLKLRNSWNVWCDSYVVKRRIKNSLRNFTKIARTAKFSNFSIRNTQNTTLNYNSPVTAINITHTEASTDVKSVISREIEEIQASLDLHQLLADELVCRRCAGTASVEWMLALITDLPHSHWEQWIIHKLTNNNNNNINNSVTLTNSTRIVHDGAVRLVARHIKSPSVDKVYVRGTSAMLVLLSDNMEYNMALINDTLIPILCKIQPEPAFPICFIYHNNNNNNNNNKYISAKLEGIECISDILYEEFTQSTPTLASCKVLSQAIIRLASNTSKQPKLICQPLREVLQHQLFNMYTVPLSIHIAARNNINLGEPKHSIIQEYYESILQHICRNITDPALTHISWPILDDSSTILNASSTILDDTNTILNDSSTILDDSSTILDASSNMEYDSSDDWNSVARLAWIAQLIRRLELPGVSVQIDTGVWRDRVALLKEYILSYTNNNSQLLSNVTTILQHTQNKTAKLDLPLVIPWSEIVSLLYTAIMQAPEYSIIVHYVHMHQYVEPRSWLASIDNISHLANYIMPNRNNNNNNNNNNNKNKKKLKRNRRLSEDNKSNNNHHNNRVLQTNKKSKALEKLENDLIEFELILEEEKIFDENVNSYLTFVTPNTNNNNNNNNINNNNSILTKKNLSFDEQLSLLEEEIKLLQD